MTGSVDLSLMIQSLRSSLNLDNHVSRDQFLSRNC